MKATEYYEKYNEKLTSSEMGIFTKATADMMQELWDEMNYLIEKRNVKCEDALIGIVKEINQKYNAILVQFERHNQKPPLKRNAFNHIVIKNIPEYANRLSDIEKGE